MDFIYLLLARLLPTSTVDRAVRAIVKVAAALAAAEDVQLKRASSLTAQINNLRGQREAAVEQAARAARIADRLKSLTA